MLDKPLPWVPGRKFREVYVTPLRSFYLFFVYLEQSPYYIAQTGPEVTMLSSKQEVVLDSQVLGRKEIIITKCR